MSNVSKWSVPLLTGVLCLGSTFAMAGTVTVEQLPEGRIAIVAEDASTTDILSGLSEAYEFKFERLGEGLGGETRSGRFEGTLRGVLARLLENDSHIIVDAFAAKAGIARITLFSAGASPGQTSPAYPGGAASAQGPAPLSRQIAATPAAPPRPAPQSYVAPSQASAAVASQVAYQRRRGGIIN